MENKKYIAGGTIAVLAILGGIATLNQENPQFTACFQDCINNYELCKANVSCYLSIPESELNNTCENICWSELNVSS